MANPRAAEQLLPFHDYSSEAPTPHRSNTTPDIAPEKFPRSQTEATAYEPEAPATFDAQPTREPRLFWFSALILVLVPSTVAAYFWVTWLYLVYPDPDDPAMYARWDGSLVFYSWFIIGVFGLDWSRYGLVRAEAAMLQSSYWKAANTAGLLLHGDKSWSGPGGWLKYLKMTFTSWSSKRKNNGQYASGGIHNRLWILLAFLSIMPFIALPLSGLSLEISDGYIYQPGPAEMIGRTPENFNIRQHGASEGYFDAPTNGWSIGAKPAIPGVGLLYTPEYLDRGEFPDSFGEIPNTFPLTGEGIPEVFVAHQAETPVSGKVWGLRLGYNCTEVTDVSQFTILNRKYSDASYFCPGVTCLPRLSLPKDQWIYYLGPDNRLAANVWGYAEIGVHVNGTTGIYDGNEPSSFDPEDIGKPGGADEFEYVLWQTQGGSQETPMPFNVSTGTQGIQGLGHPIIQHSNGSFSINETFFQVKTSDTNRTLTNYLIQEIGLPPVSIMYSLAPPIGFKCRSVSSPGEAYLNPDKSTFHSFEKLPPARRPIYGETPRFGSIAWNAMHRGSFFGLFTSTNSYPRLAAANSYYYPGFVTPDILQRSILQAYAMDALALMYDGNYGFGQAWENNNVTSSKEGKVLTVGRVHPVIPAVLFTIWAVGCAVLGLWYGFRRRSTDSLNGYSFVRIGVELADQVKQDSDFWGADRFKDSKTLQNLPGAVGDFKPQMG